LYVILRSGPCVVALRLWHEDQFNRFDFSSNALHLEVVATVCVTRVHGFAHEQLEPPSQDVGIVTSLMLQPLTGEQRVLDLARSIDETMCANAELRL